MHLGVSGVTPRNLCRLAIGRDLNLGLLLLLAPLVNAFRD